jgi:DNA-directed RNA polymerase subunit RPC12/RpoP
MTWIDIDGIRYDSPTADDVTQIHYLARLDRGGASRVEVRTTGRLLDCYSVTKGTAKAIGRCLRCGQCIPLVMARAGLRCPELGSTPILAELERVRGRYARWCSAPAPAPRRSTATRST